MRIIRLLSVSAVMLTSGYLYVPAAELDDATTLRLLTHEKRQEDIARMSPERRAELSKQVKIQARSAASPHEFDSTLLHLGDEETIQKQAELALHGDDNQAMHAISGLGSCRDPRAIAAMAPVLFLGDDSWRSETATRSILGMIAITRGFSSDVYNWNSEARETVAYFSRLILREWWKANAVHFQNRDYLVVQPGALPPKGGFEPTIGPDGKAYMRKLPGAPDWTPIPSPAGAVIPSPAPHVSQAVAPPVENLPTARPYTSHNATYVFAAVLTLLTAAGVVRYAIRRR